ncbi:hypothetical protein RE9431_18240 [Prescottella equi]|nr:hypothetical protein RE9431_18240 [Prescottella equi]
MSSSIIGPGTTYVTRIATTAAPTRLAPSSDVVKSVWTLMRRIRGASDGVPSRRDPSGVEADRRGSIVVRE